MNTKAAAISAAVLTAVLLILLVVNYVVWGLRNQDKGTQDATFTGTRPPHCDPTLTNRQAVKPAPTVGVSTGYDWVAANYALNMFQEGARAYAMNEQPVPFPHTSTVATLSGKNADDPKTVAEQRLKNIVWIVKVPGKGTEPDQIYLIFRGTQSNPDWIVNASVLLTPWHPDYPGVQVHAGYNTVMAEIKDALYAALRKAVTRVDNTVIYVTGLSLGGGLSTVAAADLVTRSPLGLKDVRLYAFSAPRVGNKAFVDMMSKAQQGGKLTDMFTIVNGADLIPTMPPDAVGYAPMPALTFHADWGDGTNNHLSAVQLAHVDRVYQKCPAVVPYPIQPLEKKVE